MRVVGRGVCQIFPLPPVAACVRSTAFHSKSHGHPTFRYSHLLLTFLCALPKSRVQTHHGPPLAEHRYISVRKSGLTYRRLPSLHRKRFLPKQITIFGVCAVSRITIAHFVRLWGKSGVRHCPADPPPYDVIPPRTQRAHTPSTLRGPLRASRVAMVIFRFFHLLVPSRTPSIPRNGREWHAGGVAAGRPFSLRTVRSS